MILIYQAFFVVFGFAVVYRVTIVADEHKS